MPTTFFPSLTYSIPPLENIFHRAFTLRNPEGPHGGCSAKECKTHSKSTDAEYWCVGQEIKQIFTICVVFLLGARNSVQPCIGKFDETGTVQKGSVHWERTVCRGRPTIGAPPGNWLPWGEERNKELPHFSLSLEACHFSDESFRLRGHGNFARQRSAGADVLTVQSDG